MTAPAADDDDSFSFCPSSDRLVDRYLRAKIDGKFSDLANAAYFLDVDVCSARPQELVRHHSMPARVPSRDAGDGQQFYFFSPARFVGTKRKKRSRIIDGTGEKESCHAEGRPKPVEGSTGGGYMTKFSYHVRNGPKIIEKPGWIMTEYSFKETNAGDMVLCKIYKSPRGPGRSTLSSSSCTSSAKSGCKRKAADDLEEATSTTRLRHSNQEEGDDMLFAGDLEHVLLSVEDRAAAPEFGETLHVEESQPEPQPVPASFYGDMVLGKLSNWIMTEEEDDGMTLLIPDGGDPEAYFMGVLFGDNKPQDATFQT